MRGLPGQEARAARYGNWVPSKMIVLPGVLGLACLGLGFLLWPLFAAAAAFLLVSGYLAFSRLLFSPRGGNLQERVQELVLSQISWAGRGKALDIGCGNGPLAIRLAQRWPEAQILGLDSWGKGWEYSLRQCQANARLAGVEQRVSFLQASASALPFAEASFDLVVSNLVFHEVREVRDKRRCLQEAIRVLKPNGVFVLQDLFLLKAFYGTPEELLRKLRSWGVAEVRLVRTCDTPFIPRVLKLPFMLGALAILRGVKQANT